MLCCTNTNLLHTKVVGKYSPEVSYFSLNVCLKSVELWGQNTQKQSLTEAREGRDL